MLVNLGTVLLYDFAFSLNGCSATCLHAAFEKQAEGTAFHTFLLHWTSSFKDTRDFLYIQQSKAPCTAC